jgi:hypothetical protein
MLLKNITNLTIATNIIALYILRTTLDVACSQMKKKLKLKMPLELNIKLALGAKYLKQFKQEIKRCWISF